MKKLFIKIGILLLLLFVSLEVTYASLGISKVFGGKIINTKATKIESLESSNYHCTVPGETIEIKPIKSLNMPKSYMIKTGTVNKNSGYKIRSGQWIVGKYSGKTTITCIFQGEPPATQTVTLDTITLYATSKR